MLVIEENTKTSFENLYLAVREKEQRIYSDEELLYLPLIRKDHPHFKEWQVRKRSAWRMIHYLQKKKRPLRILEIGCGNGWLCHQLASIVNCTIIGTDINQYEIEQGKRVFSHIANLELVSGEWQSAKVLSRNYDIILFAASLQYFPDLKEIITACLKYLKKYGEIHIIDSPFYEISGLESAKKRTEDYYRLNGYPEMTQYYFHHLYDQLNHFTCKMLYNPKRSRFPFLKTNNPFPWICIKNDDEL